MKIKLTRNTEEYTPNKTQLKDPHLVYQKMLIMMTLKRTFINHHIELHHTIHHNIYLVTITESNGTSQNYKINTIIS